MSCDPRARPVSSLACTSLGTWRLPRHRSSPSPPPRRRTTDRARRAGRLRRRRRGAARSPPARLPARSSRWWPTARCVFTRGYGFADVPEHGPPSIGQRTLFRPGSVSKLFTWTALMQQVEQGRVDLDADVNRVSRLQDSRPFEGTADPRARPVLAQPRHERRERHHRARAPTRPHPLSAVAEGAHSAAPVGAGNGDRLFELWRCAGRLHRRARFGRAVSRLRRAAHLRAARHDARRPSASRCPLRSPRAWRSATSWSTAGSCPHPIEYCSRRSCRRDLRQARAPDMARFMLAMLGGARWARRGSCRRNRSRCSSSNSLANAPDLPGMAHGFLVYRDAGPRLVGHAGNTGDFHSDLIIAPEKGNRLLRLVHRRRPGSSIARTEVRDAIDRPRCSRKRRVRARPATRRPRRRRSAPIAPIAATYKAGQSRRTTSRSTLPSPARRHRHGGGHQDRL